MKPPDNLTYCDAIRGILLAFNTRAGRGLYAVIQFRIIGTEPGGFYLRIANQECLFHKGVFPELNVSIHARSEIWPARPAGNRKERWHI